MARGNEKFIRRQKEVERQKAQEEKRKKRAERKAAGLADPGDDDVAAIQAALDSGVDPTTLNANVEGEDGEAAGEGGGEGGDGKDDSAGADK